MSNSDLADDPLANASREEIMSALFGHMVIQNTNMALMFLGQVPHPQSGERVQDFEAARMFIDQLEMLELKTKGNLSREEEKLLQQSLTHLRMTFVQVMDSPPPSVEAGESGGARTDASANFAVPDSATKSETSPALESAPEAAVRVEEPAEPESRKRYSKKF